MRIDNAGVTVDDLLGRHEWEAAAAAAANIRRLFPEVPAAVELAKRVGREKEPHRRRLKRRFLEAARGDDPEPALELLKEMDRLFTRAEAAPMLEVAQEVIERVKQSLAARFKDALSEKDWQGATRIGDRIIRDFGNTRMAEEVGEMIDLLRERATEQQQAAS